MTKGDHETEGTSSGIRLNMWKQLAGQHLGELLTSPDAAERFLKSESWKLRFVAISVLNHKWRACGRLVHIFEQLAASDPHDQVRAVALQAVARCYESSRDPRVAKLFSGIVQSAFEPLCVRESAYVGLHWILEIPAAHLATRTRFRFPDDVDWNLVRAAAEIDSVDDGG